MSTLSTANIQSKAANTPPVIKDLNGTECGQFARAWVNFNGTASAVSVRASFNVSSITENAAGDYTINFTNAMSSADYCVSGGASALDGTAGYRWLAVGSAYGSDFSKTASAVRVQAVYEAATHTQAEHVYAVIHGG